MSDSEASNDAQEDSGDERFVLPERTTDDFVGKVDDNSDPVAVIERFQNNAENIARKKEFAAKKKQDSVNSINTKFLNPGKIAGPASHFGDGDGSFWDRWMGPLKLPSKGSSASGTVEPFHGAKKSHADYCNRAVQIVREKELEQLEKMARLSRAAKHRTGHHPHGGKLSPVAERNLAENMKRKTDHYQQFSTYQKNEVRSLESSHVRNKIKLPELAGASTAKMEMDDMDPLIEEFLELHPNHPFTHSSQIKDAVDHKHLLNLHLTESRVVGKKDPERTPRYHMLHPCTLEKKMDVETRLHRHIDPSTKRVDDVVGHIPKPELIPEPLMIKSQTPQKLNVAYYGLGDIRSHRLGNSISKLDHLEELNIQNNRVTPKSVVSMLNNLGTNDRLRLLNLSENKIGYQGALALSKFLKTASALTTVVLQSTNFTCRETLALCTALESNRSISEIDLSKNKIGERGATAIAGIIESTSAIKCLNLNWNYIRGQGALAISHAIGRNASLTTLNLGFNGFANKATEFIATSIEHNKTLTSLDLTQNNIGPEATIVLADGLETNEDLTFLILDQNPIGKKGARAMLRLFGGGEEDTTLSLQGCNIDIDDMSIFEPNEMQKNYSLDLTESPYDRAVLKDIIRKAERHRGVTITNVFYGEDAGAKREIAIDHSVDTEGLRTLCVAGSPWEGYSHGYIELEIQQVPHKASLDNALSQGALENLLSVILNESSTARYRRAMMELTCVDMFFTTEQVIYMVNRISKREEENRIHAAIELMQRIVDPDNMILFHEALDDHVLAALKAEIGQYFYFIPKNPGDHYTLDLAKKYDRVILEKLLEINSHDVKYSMMKSQRRDTSQHGDWQNFRNTVYNEVAIEPPRTLARKFQTKIPHRGMIEFDYVTQRRVHAGTRAVGHKYFTNLLRDLGIMTEEEWAATKIATIIRGKIGRRRAAHVAEQKEKLLGHSINAADPTVHQVLSIVYKILSVSLAEVEDMTITEFHEAIQLDESERPQILLKRATSDFFEMLEPAERDDLGTPDVKTLREFVVKYQSGNLFIRWFATLTGWVGDSVHERIKTNMSEQANLFFLVTLKAFETSDAPFGEDTDGDATMIESSVVTSYLETAFEPHLDECDMLTNHLEDAVGKIQDLTVSEKMGLYDAVDLAMRLWYYKDPVNDKLDSDTDEEEGGDGTAADDDVETPEELAFKAKELSEEQKRRNAEMESIRLKYLYPLHKKLSFMYITCSELSMAVHLLPAKYPEVRAQTVQKLFSRIVDLERFHTLLASFDTDVENLLWDRIGWLNLFNPSFPDRYYYLRLEVYEMRQIAKMLVKLAIVEPGENWQDELYWKVRFGAILEEPEAGWELPTGWIAEEGIPKEGIVSLQYYSGADKQCYPKWEERADLQERCLVGDGGWRRVMKYDFNSIMDVFGST